MAFLLTSLSCSLLSAILATTTPPPTSPHILFILADDYGWNDIGYHANRSAVGYYNSANPAHAATTTESAGMMRTPTLDLLAAEGCKLESYYVQPLCSPTRSTIMTGRYASHTGIGPDVLVENVPYGTPAREMFLPQYLPHYRRHAIGKWHLGKCDDRYMATYRGFDSYQGYLDGAQSYWRHAGDYRNSSTLSTSANHTPACSTKAEVDGQYSAALEVAEVDRIVQAHPKDGTPLFIYLAMHSVHGPTESATGYVPDVNITFPLIVDYQRRVFAGMVSALDLGVSRVVESYKAAGLWRDTVLVFSTDNGGIGNGNNFPLRGCKVLNWEGGVHGIGFVRGTDSSLAPVPAGSVTHELMHTTDWLPTLVALGGGDVSGSALPLDGVDQWKTIATGAPTARKFIIHNVPITARPIAISVTKKNVTKQSYTTSVCLSAVDNRTGLCHAFGVTGGAIRVGDFKLLVSSPVHAPWEDSSPPGIGQGLPGGGHGFTPDPVAFPLLHKPPQPVGNVFDAHLKRNVSIYVFNIRKDPQETINLANDSAFAAKTKELLDFYNNYAAKSDTVMGLSWRYGFQDPHANTVPLTPGAQRCTGAFNANGGSEWCHYGGEWECFVRGRAPSKATAGASTVARKATTTAACQAACAAQAEIASDSAGRRRVKSSSCTWWVLRNTTTEACHLYSDAAIASNDFEDCDGCVGTGPSACPGMTGAPKESDATRAMTPKTVGALLDAAGAAHRQHDATASSSPEAVTQFFKRMGELDDLGYFSGRR